MDSRQEIRSREKIRWIKISTEIKAENCRELEINTVMQSILSSGLEICPAADL
ncbi:hypothetical protein Mapa_012398 [Marchantia paleacea]|nr:hypothetical protein Mapa_012398 [Marchantia paleacea]